MEYVAKRWQGAKAGLTLDTEALKKYDDIIDLSIGDTDFVTDQRIIDAAFRDAKAGATHYGFPKGTPELISAIGKAWNEDFRQQIPEDEILVTASSSLGMALALMAVVNPGDEVIVFGPYFTSYKQQIELAGGVCVEVPTYERENYRIDEERLLAAITPKTRGIIINNPVNPTGAVYDRHQLEIVAKAAENHDLLIIADEIYTKYLYEDEFIPIRTLPRMESRTITLNSFSKNFMMTGWRVGYMIAPAPIINAASHVNDGLIYVAPMPSQRAAIAALSLRNEMEELYISKYRDRVYYASDRIEKIPYMTLLRPRGTFYLFPGIEKTGMTAPEFVKYALENAHVMVSSGDVFGEAGKGHFRIACTQPMEKIAEAMDRLEKLKF